MDLGIEPNLSDYVPKGISGFYEKQFERLKTGLQRFNPDTSSSILKSFVNVIAASRVPLPMKILVECMDVSSEEFEIREAIIGIMSEVLPIYEGCLTVYHKSLWDWLILDGYEEHAFVAVVADGNERLWRVCKSVYSDINDLSSVSDFQMSPETKYALENGGNLLLNVADTEDFHWLVNVRVNYLKLKICDSLNADFSRILTICKSKLSDPIFWAIIQLHAILRYLALSYSLEHKKECYIYLQSLVNGHFLVLEMNNNSENEARNILDKSNEPWVEELRNERNFKFKIISHAVYDIPNLDSKIELTALSPDNKLFACYESEHLEVFNLPTLTVNFQLNISEKTNVFEFLIFSPDSSYLLLNSVRTCISIVDQKEIPFIPHGPEDIRCCSFSSCGTRLVTFETGFIKVWDVIKKNLLVEVKNLIYVDYCCFSKCNSHILATNWSLFSSDVFALFDSRTLASLKAGDICADTCLTYKDNYQIISPCHNDRFSTGKIRIDHFHFPTAETLLVAKRHCSKPFNWKNKKCVIFSKCPRSASPLVVYDFMNKEIIDEFHINCFPNHSKIVYISNLDETHFLICLSYGHIFLLSFETSAEPPRASFVNNADVKCCALSPDNLYLACCFKNSVLTVRSVDNGETVQTVKLKQRPKACWWSELFLWVVYKGVVVKYPYDSTQRKVLGNELEECTINFDKVLKFANDVLVIMYDGKIFTLKCCKEKLYRQQVSDLNSLNPKYRDNIFFSFFDTATVSSDGCAVLWYGKRSSNYQVWEITCDNRWELHSAGRFDGSRDVRWLFLTGTKNSRNSLRLYLGEHKDYDIYLSSVDLSNSTHHTTHKLPYSLFLSEAPIYGDSQHLIFKHNDRIDFVKVADSEIVASLYLGKLASLEWNVSTFYIASRSLLLLVGETDINFFKIHNIENCLL
jgi:hypothetical protein